MTTTDVDLHQFTKDVTQMLSDQQLCRLRSGYDAELLSDLATQTVVQKFPASQVWISTIQRILFKDPANGNRPLLDLSAKERELCLVTLLSAQAMDLELAVHIYWGLMEGLEPKELAALITVVGVYAGLDKFNSALDVMTKTMHALDKVASSGACQVPDVIPAIVGAFEGA